MTLRDKQEIFAVAVGSLIRKAIELGFTVTLGEAWRPPEQAKIMAEKGKGSRNSLHIVRLALDINLFKDGVYLENSEDHLELGKWWESQSTVDLKFCWGGRFAKPDGNHYSIGHEGRQ